MDILLLHPDQLTRRILNVLNELSPTKNVTLGEAKLAISRQLSHNCFTYVGYVDGEPVAVGSLVILDKIIHECGYVALVEDVAVRRSCQGKGYGRKLVDFLVSKAAREGCYKVILNCSDDKEPFYNKCGFSYHSLCMRKDLSIA